MTRPLRLQYENAFYHIISRGNQKNYIFKKISDKTKFIEKMDQAFNKYNINCYAYCIMDNHYHLYISTPEGNLSEFMRYLNTSYANWYRIKSKKSGHVFQGRYKSILVDKDNYSLKLVNYIHANPVRAKIAKKPEDYKFSGLQYYLGVRGSIIEDLNKYFILDLFDKDIKIASLKYYKHLIENIDNDVIKKEIYKSLAIGDEIYIKEIEKKLEKIPRNVELKSTNMTKTRYPEKILKTIEKEFSISEEDIFSSKYKNIYKKIAIYLLGEKTRLRLHEIGEMFKLSRTSISMIIKRFKLEIEKDDNLRNKIKKICDM